MGNVKFNILMEVSTKGRQSKAIVTEKEYLLLAETVFNKHIKVCFLTMTLKVKVSYYSNLETYIVANL